MDIKLIPNEVLLQANKELTSAYSKALIEETKNPNNVDTSNSIKRYKKELETFRLEILKRKLKVN